MPALTTGFRYSTLETTATPGFFFYSVEYLVPRTWGI